MKDACVVGTYACHIRDDVAFLRFLVTVRTVVTSNAVGGKSIRGGGRP